MTDNEIIKALNYCCGNIKNNDEECNEDMCYQVCLPESREEGIRWCGEWLMKDALDLINRQKAEIERLLQKLQQAKSEALMHAFSKFAGHSDYHGDTILCQLTCMAEGKETKSAIPIDMNQIKSKAIKKFAERLKDEMRLEDDCQYDCMNCLYECKGYVLIIDILVKEMTEEKSDV